MDKIAFLVTLGVVILRKILLHSLHIKIILKIARKYEKITDFVISFDFGGNGCANGKGNLGSGAGGK